MCLNFTANSFVFGSTNRDIALRTFYIKHAKRKRQKCIWTSQQISLFLAPKKSRKCAQNFFCKPHKARTSKMRLNFTANSFVFGHKYLENAPRTFFLTCKVKTSKMRLNVASETEPFTDVTVNWDSHAVQTCHVTSLANHVWLMAK